MKSLYYFITEKFKINSNTVKKHNCIYNDKSSEAWDISNAEDGDIVYLNSLYLKGWFIYKDIDSDEKYGGSDKAIIYYIFCHKNPPQKISIGPTIGVGSITNHDKMYLATDKECEEFAKVLKEKGYEWDPINKELIKI